MRVRPVLVAGTCSLVLVACDTDSHAPTYPIETRPIFELENPHTHVMLPRGRDRGSMPSSDDRSRSGAGPMFQYMGGNGIDDHHGPIILDPKVAAIYWSSRTVYLGGPAVGTTGVGSADGSLVGFFLRHVGGSAYYNINATYATKRFDGTIRVEDPELADQTFGANIRNNITYTQYWAANSNAPAVGSTVSDAAIRAQITAGLVGGQLTYDSSTAYLVFGDSAVNLGGGFGTQYCAYHGHFIWNQKPVRYAVMPRIQNVSGCDDLDGSPNGDTVADAEMSALVHEIEEINTDPDLNAWYDSQGQENADKCAHTYGTTYATANGATANVNLSGKDFLIQQNWLNVYPGAGCVLGYSRLTAAILGPTNITTPGTYTWEVFPSGGTGSYTYVWTRWVETHWDGWVGAPNGNIFTTTETGEYDEEGPPYPGNNWFRVYVGSGSDVWFADIRVLVCVFPNCGGP